MQTEQFHIIQQQVFELTIASSKAGFEWERKAAGYLREYITPGVDDCFRDLSFADQYLMADKLVIDLGIFSPESFAKEARQRLARLLRKQLLEYSMDGQGRKKEHDQVKKKNKYPVSKDDTESQMARLLSDFKVRQIALSHFLHLGRFPWWWDQHKRSVGFEEQFGPDWMQSLNGSEKAELKKALLTTMKARLRLANHFGPKWIGGFLQYLGLRGNKGYKQWRQLSPVLKSFPELHSLIHQNFWVAWMKNGGKEDPLNIELLTVNTEGANMQLLSKLREALCERHFGRNTDSGISSKSRPILKSPENKDKPAFQVEDQTKSRSRTTKSRSGTIVNDVDPEFAGEVLPEDFGKIEREEELFVHGAGIVLLHSFLPELFSNTGLWDRQTWTSQQAQFQAVQLLSFLTYGKTNVPEYQLLFHKALVGMDLERALEVGLPLTSAEMAACNELLQAVIHHWNALRNTSSEGLREAFLQREGKLGLFDDGYHLRVEQKTQDVLLSYLSWGYSIIKLPWTPIMFHVSWI